MEWWGAIFLSNKDAAGLTSARDLTDLASISNDFPKFPRPRSLSY